MWSVYEKVKKGDYHGAAVEVLKHIKEAGINQLELSANYAKNFFLEAEDPREKGFWRHVLWLIIAEAIRRIRTLEEIDRSLAHPREIYLLGPLSSAAFFPSRRDLASKVREEKERLKKILELIEEMEEIKREKQVVTDLRTAAGSVEDPDKLEKILEHAESAYRFLYGFELGEKLPARFEGNAHPDQLRKHSPLWQVMEEIRGKLRVLRRE